MSFRHNEVYNNNKNNNNNGITIIIIVVAGNLNSRPHASYAAVPPELYHQPFQLLQKKNYQELPSPI